MYGQIKRVGRFARGLVDPFYRISCFYEKFNDEWKECNIDAEGRHVEERIHHKREGEKSDCSLVNWVCNFGAI